MASDPKYVEHDGDHTPDEWHSHTRAEGVPQPEHAAHVNVAALTAVFAVSTVLLVVTVVVLVIYFDAHMTQLRAERVETTQLAEDHWRPYRQQSFQKLDSFGWVDRDAGIVQVPIDDAKRIVVEQYQQAGDMGRVPTEAGTIAETPMEESGS